MKTSLKTLLTTVTLAGAALLTGCATHPDLKASFNRGEEVLYGRVFKVWTGADMGVAHNLLCGNKYPVLKGMGYSAESDKWVKDTNFCSKENLDKIKQVRLTVAVTDANGTMHNAVVFVPKELEIDEGDIVAYKVFPSGHGPFRRPEEFIKIAAKAKDATKEKGCYWDAGTGVWSGFNQGGAVCEGWHWKNHPFSNPKLLKQ